MQLRLEKLRKDARFSYELGRVRFSLRALYFVIPLSVLASFTCARPSYAGGMAFFWGALAVYFLWKGQDFARAAWTGLIWGTIIGTIPILAELTGKCCSLGSHELLCLGIGALAGSVAVIHSLSAPGNRSTFLAVTGTTMALASALGCAPLGLGSLIPVVGGLLLPTGPAIFWLRHRSALA